VVCADGFLYTNVRLPCELGGIPVRGGAGQRKKKTNNLYNFNTMFTKHSMPQHYEAPLVRMHQISAESGFATSLGAKSINQWVEEDDQNSLSF